MFSHLSGVLRRLPTIVGALCIVAGMTAPAAAHEGHDHGAPPPAVAVASTPRVAIQSDAYELVGVLSGDRLRLFLDRFGSNEAVSDAAILVTIGGDEEVRAEPAPDGAFTVPSRKFTGQGPLEMIFAVTAASGDDLLIGTLQLPAEPAAPAAAALTPTRTSPFQGLQITPTVRVGSAEVATPYVIAGVALALGFLLGLMARGRGKLAPLAGLTLVALVVSTAYAFSHEGHDHGAEAAKAALPAGDTPRRLSDGTLFVPKPSQRVLQVRTILAKPEVGQKAVTLIGRVTGDPNRGGVVQSLSGGRIVPGDAGLPSVGQTVRKGDVLARIERALPPEERVNLSEKAGEIEQLIAVAETKIKRVRQLAERGITAQGQFIDAETELEGLKRRREIIRSTRAELEELRASADGVISAARVAAGQVVGAQDVLFQIIHPKGLLVEALAYGEVDPAKLTGASAVGADGTVLKLAFKGFSKALQQQATSIQFTVDDPPANLAVGQPVTVIARNGAAVSAIILPREAVVRGGNGEALVWRHTEPERFEAKPVRTEPFDAARLIVRAGVDEGDRVVTRGAELINQIR